MDFNVEQFTSYFNIDEKITICDGDIKNRIFTGRIKTLFINNNYDDILQMKIEKATVYNGDLMIIVHY